MFFHALALTFALSASLQTHDAVVAIYSDLGNRTGHGTGFFVSDRGEILTAYHVVYGARKITINYHGKKYDDVMLGAINADADLAILTVNEPGSSARPYALVRHPVSYQPRHPITAIGNARGLPNQHLSGTITQTGMIRSEQLRDGKGRRLLSVDGVNLWPVAVTGIYNGVSGGPVFTDDGVIGVLSGSFNEGGSIAWAIPVTYLDAMQPINRRPRDMAEWPPLMTTDAFRSLRSTFRLDSRVAQLIEDYFDALDEFESSFDAVNASANDAAAGIEVMLGVTAASPSAWADLADELLWPPMQGLADAHKANGRIESRIHTLSSRLLDEVEKTHGSLPRTALNLRATVEVQQTAEAIDAKFGDSSALPAMGGIDMLNRLAVLSEADVEGQSAYDRVRQMLGELHTALQNDLSMEQMSQQNRRVDHLREIGQLLESVVYRPVDWPEGERRYASERGFSITFPSGWVVFTPELGEFFPAPAPEPTVDIVVLRTGFFGDDAIIQRNDSTLVNNVVVTTVDQAMPPVTDAVIPFLSQQYRDQVARIQPNMRDFRMEMAHFGSITGLEVRTTYGAWEHPRYSYQAFIPGPTMGVWVSCQYHRPGDLAECRTIANTLQF